MAVASLATLLSLIDGTEYYANSALAGAPIAWWKATGFELFKWYTWAVLVPPIVVGTRRAARRAWPLAAAWHGGAAFGFSLVQVTTYALFS
jgi:hypothetical protein